MPLVTTTHAQQVPLVTTTHAQQVPLVTATHAQVPPPIPDNVFDGRQLSPVLPKVIKMFFRRANPPLLARSSGRGKLQEWQLRALQRECWNQQLECWNNDASEYNFGSSRILGRITVSLNRFSQKCSHQSQNIIKSVFVFNLNCEWLFI